MHLTKQQTEKEQVLQKAREDAIVLSKLSGCVFYQSAREDPSPSGDWDESAAPESALFSLEF